MHNAPPPPAGKAARLAPAPETTPVPGETGSLVALTPLADPATRWLDRFTRTRDRSTALCEPLEIEDYQLQSMPDASPPKWHLAHTTWFFETFLLKPHAAELRTPSGSYREFHPAFTHLFNSYYVAVGPRPPRFGRGLVSRPTVREVLAYRRHVDAAIAGWLAAAGPDLPGELQTILELGLNHEEQHQELLLTDLKHAFSQNPLLPAYRPEAAADPVSATTPAKWLRFEGGLVEVGHRGSGFHFDNEGPEHPAYLRPFELMSRLVTTAEYQRFIDDNGYTRPELWLSDGWAVCERERWAGPLYWLPPDPAEDGPARQFTLAGAKPRRPDEPATHLSFYEADAYARWSGVRLATEFEWEHAAKQAGGDPTRAAWLAADASCHPRPATGTLQSPLDQAYGETWQWTASPYTPYPGYRPQAGALGEYNGKFMCNQMVLRGGSCASPPGHVRRTYRNFFPPEARWQFTGIRLARDV